MRKVLVSLAAGAALAASAGTATADGGYGYGSVKDAAPMAAPVQQVNWNGLYIGAAVGYGIATTELDARYEELDYPDWEVDQFASANLSGISSEGFQGVVTIGYDRQIHPGVVIGVFGDYAFGDLESEASLNFDNWFTAGLDAEISNSWAIGARLGFIRSSSTMWYLAAGYSQADLDWEISAFDTTVASGGKTLSGWFIGGGVEHQLRDNLFLKLDYRYTNYDTERLFSWEDQEGGQWDIYRAHLDSQTDVHSIRLGVNWKVDLFGGHHAAPAYEPMK